MSNATLEQQMRSEYNKARAYLQIFNHILKGTKFNVKLVKYKKGDKNDCTKDGYTTFELLYYKEVQTIFFLYLRGSHCCEDALNELKHTLKRSLPYLIADKGLKLAISNVDGYIQDLDKSYKEYEEYLTQIKNENK